MSTNRPSLWRVLSETWHIILVHFRHFLALSILFIFPNAVAAIIYSFLLQPTSLHSHLLRFLSGVSTPESDVGKSQLPIQLVYFLSIFLFNLCAISSITYTTFHGFYGAPVKFISSLKSILVSFFPLLATMLVVEMIMGLIIVGFVLLTLVAYNGLALLGLEIDYNDGYFLAFVIVMMGLLIYLQVEWYLMNAVVVLESKWGFASLKRSSRLVKGMRGVVLLTLLLFGTLSGLWSIWLLNAGKNYEGLNAWFLLQMLVSAVFSTILSLFGLAANAVLFVYGKAMTGETTFQIHDGYGVEYTRLPSDVVNTV